MNQTTDAKKAFYLSLLVGVSLVFALSQAIGPAFLKAYWRVLVYGSLRPGSAITNLEALGILILGTMLTVFLPALHLYRRLGLRQTGDMLDQAQKELRGGMKGIGGLRKQLR